MGLCLRMDTEEESLLVENSKDDQIIDDQISENKFSNGNCITVTSPTPSRRSDEPTELSFEKSEYTPITPPIIC